MKKILLPFLLLCSTIAFAQNDWIELFEVADGFSQPLNIQNAGDDRLFIVEKTGTIKIIENVSSNPTVLQTPFLDISSQVSTTGEQGLLGLAFHPDFANNSMFYIYYTDTNGDSTLSSFEVDAQNPNQALTASENVMLTISQPFSNHNGGCIAFGPDGMLYIGSGDGGSGGDPNDNAQNLNSLLGKILRLDVDATAPYIPSDNPYVNNPNAEDEIWAVGLRNPWKFSFDSQTGDIWIGDVGQNAIEEISKTNNTAALNYGWRCYEGNAEFNDSGNCPPDNDLVFPFAQYTHNNSGLSKCSVTGGYVYRGSDSPSLVGNYIFADFCSDEIGIINNSGVINFTTPFSGNSFSSFGVDQNDELYVAGLASGKIFKIEELQTASVEDFSLKNLQLFPNPTQGKLQLKSTTTLKNVSVYGLDGKKISSEEINSKNFELNVTQLPTGIYLLKVSDSNHNFITKQIIVQ